MKKVIIFSLVLALVAGAAFAQVAVSGTVETRFTVAAGDSLDDSKPVTYGSIGAAYLQLSGQNNDGTLGALFRFRNEDVVRDKPWFHRVFTWWQPIPQMRLFLGIDQDGKFATDALEGWAFHQGGEGFFTFHEWNFWRAVFPGNWDGFGMAFTFLLVDGLDINLVIPTGNMAWPQATQEKVENKVLIEDMYVSGLRLQAGYNIPDIGKILFSYVGPGENFSEQTEKQENFGQIGASFLLTAVDGLQAHLGFATYLTGSDVDSPIWLGAAAHYAGGDFGVKFRFGMEMGTGDDKSSYMTGNIMPWYNLGPLTAYLDIGLISKKFFDPKEESGTAWFVTPYAKVPIAGGLFQFGLRIYSNIGASQHPGYWNSVDVANSPSALDANKDAAPVKFEIPLRFVYSF